MKRTILAASLALACLTPTAALAQEEAGTRIGLGTSFGAEMTIFNEDLLFIPLSFNNIYVPILVGESLRLEPEIGFFRYGDTDDAANVLRIGTGVFYMTWIENMELYVGFRVGLSYLFESGDDNDSRTDIYFGPAGGAEHFFADYFSLGVEIQLNYIRIGDLDRGFPGSRAQNNEHLVSTRGMILARFYFN
ncbi:hypothetical protein ACFL6C_06015 [Myxococcota bacterium]